MAEFHQVESHYNWDRHDVGEITCSFRSDYRKQGTMLRCVDGSVKVADGQPNLHMYPKDEQQYMKQATLVAYRLTFGKASQDLSSQSA